MGIFSGRHFPREIILWAVRWYCRYGVSYRDLEEMMTERGAPVDHTTIYRWVQKYAPELDKQTRWYRQVPDWQARSWRVDETYIRVGGKWCYLYRAITAGGNTLDFYLSPKRNVAAAKRFLAKTLRSNTTAGFPRVMVLLQSWVESSEDSVSHFLMATAGRRSQAVSKTRLTITASGFGCP